jgi:hypothetical protein
MVLNFTVLKIQNVAQKILIEKNCAKNCHKNFKSKKIVTRKFGRDKE